jgi:hypothetical protein
MSTTYRYVLPVEQTEWKFDDKSWHQRKFDHLADRAAAGDWAAVHAYEVKGVNTYAKMLSRYRDRPLAFAAAHAAQKADAA